MSDRSALLSKIAVLANGLMIIFGVSTLSSKYLDPFPFRILAGACLLSVLNIGLILWGKKLQPRLRSVLRQIAMVGNTAFSLVFVLAGILSFALLGGGGRFPVVATIEVLAVLCILGVSIRLNLFVIRRI
jgi:hypothetical protein